MEGLRCAVCRDRFLIGEKIHVVGNMTARDDGYEFDINSDKQQEICAIHSNCGKITLHFAGRDGKQCHITIAEE